MSSAFVGHGAADPLLFVREGRQSGEVKHRVRLVEARKQEFAFAAGDRRGQQTVDEGAVRAGRVVACGRLDGGQKFVFQQRQECLVGSAAVK